MTITPTYPGVYIQELPSGVRTITGVATSITAFIGRSKRGPINEPVTINSFADFERTFGGLWQESPLTFAVQDFYLNGGSQAIIVRLFKESAGDDAAGTAHATYSGLRIDAAAPGEWGNSLRFRVDHQAKTGTFNLQVHDKATGATELFRNLTADGDRAVDRVLNHESLLVRSSQPANIPEAHQDASSGKTIWEDNRSSTPLGNGNKGVQLDANSFTGTPTPEADDAEEPRYTVELVSFADEAKLNVITAVRGITGLNLGPSKKIVEGDLPQSVIPAGESEAGIAKEKAESIRQQLEESGAQAKVTKVTAVVTTAETNAGDAADSQKSGLQALDNADLFNLLCIPPLSFDSSGDVPEAVLTKAAVYCEKRRAMLIIDPPAIWTSKDKAKAGINTLVDTLGEAARNAAVYFPRLGKPNPLRGGQIETFAPSGAVAGVIARTDSQRGIWKAPAGRDAALNGVLQLSVPLTDDENGELNPLGINCLRGMPAAGNVIWGARTVVGSDQQASEWKYIPVRRLALFIEESLYRGTQWAVFEPNDEPLWAQIRLNLGTFMHDLFRKGAFQGTTAREAYFVKCDSETTTQSDINQGIVNIVVGFAPLKPAEFVIISLQQMAGQL